MQFIYEIKRDGSRVIIYVHSNLKTKTPIYPFKFELKDTEYAELLKDHLLQIEKKFYEFVAKNPEYFIFGKDISRLKSKLVKHWDGKNHCWKN